MQTTVASNNVLFNPSCEFSCGDDGLNKCDLAIMKLSPGKVPAIAKKAALPVYRWRDEKGKTIDTYGYGTTGNAAKLSKVRVRVRVRVRIRVRVGAMASVKVRL